MEMKRSVYELCLQSLDAKIGSLKSEIAAVQESAISDTKSSMGDKYETGREVMMQEINRLDAQLAIFLKQSAILAGINVDHEHSEVRNGCLVKTDSSFFFLCVPIGLLKIQDIDVFAISMSSPIANEMAGKKEGDIFSFNKKTYKILAIE